MNTQIRRLAMGMVLLYSALFVVEVWLMIKYVRKGPYLDQEAVDAFARARADVFHLPHGGSDRPVTGAPAE